MANAFLNSGAKTVIASLWPIYDRSTSELVNIFYENYFELNDPSIALYQAQEIYSKMNPNYPPSKLFPFIVINN